MKVRSGFVSNSSSCSFVIVNATGEELQLADFVKENVHLLEMYRREYDQEDEERYADFALIQEAESWDYPLVPGANDCEFGDENGSGLETVFDYILRDGGSSERFEWSLTEINR